MIEPLSPEVFRAALLAVPPVERDAWLDRALGIDGVPDDGPELPRGCVPYLPCGVDTLLRMTALAEVHASDVFVDVGAGIGRAAAFTHLVTGATAIGIEIQPALVAAAHALIARSRLAGVEVIAGDALDRTELLARGTVFFLYCPFGGEHLTRLLASLEPIARRRPIRLCCVDLPLPPCDWLVHVAAPDSDLAIYRSSSHALEKRAPLR